MSANGNKASVKVFKFDPGVDKGPRYETFQVPYEGKTVLNVLDSIYRDLDPGLSFRFGCEGKHDSRCGACAVLVNGAPALCCRKVSDREMVIEPHPRFEIVKDLVVDFNRVRKAIPQRAPSVKITIDEEKCSRCADCVDICPVGAYEAIKGKIVASGAEFCCGDTCNQCITYCQNGAIAIEGI